MMSGYSSQEKIDLVVTEGVVCLLFSMLKDVPSHGPSQELMTFLKLGVLDLGKIKTGQE